jgi:hypothetical protein
MADRANRIDIDCIGHNAKGLLWRVTHDGKVILETSRTPAFDACRLLLAFGKTGRLEIYFDEQHRLSVDIVTGAGLTVIDNAHEGPVIKPYKVFKPVDEKEDDEISSLIG